ncbi:MAG: TetR/AcrR family transcriptional regulator [Acidimicrobiales bacterium]
MTTITPATGRNWPGDGRDAVEPRESILVAAATCLSERGFDRSRLRDVSKYAGVSIGLVQHYFETRDQLLREAFSWSCNELIGRWRLRAESWPDDPWRRIVYLVDELTLGPDLKRHAATWTEFCASAARHAELRRPVSEVFVAWRSLMVDAIEQATALGQAEPEMEFADIADILNALVDGFEMATAVDAGLVTAERFRALVIAVASSLLRPSPVTAPPEPPPSRATSRH